MSYLSCPVKIGMRCYMFHDTIPGESGQKKEEPIINQYNLPLLVFHVTNTMAQNNSGDQGLIWIAHITNHHCEKSE